MATLISGTSAVTSPGRWDAFSTRSSRISSCAQPLSTRSSPTTWRIGSFASPPKAASGPGPSSWWALLARGGQGGDAEAALRIGAALELIQTCALVHDDVMDGSTIRRGRPALHADVEAQYADAGAASRTGRFGEAAAILAA